MKKDICERTFDLAVRIVKLCQTLDENPGVGRTLSKQLLRSGTSIGANMQEAQAAQSRADFIHKVSVSLKEARETHYWLRLLIATEILPETRLLPLQNEVDEITRILGKIIVSTKNFQTYTAKEDHAEYLTHF